VENLDVSAMNGTFKVAKAALLDDFVETTQVLENILEKDISASAVEQWPLFIQYRRSDEYKKLVDKHRELFAIQGYNPEEVTMRNEDEIVSEFGEKMEILVEGKDESLEIVEEG